MKSLFDTEIERQYGKVEYQFDGETIARHRTRMESASEIRKLDRLTERSAAVAKAIGRFMDIGAKKPKRTYGRKWCDTKRPKPRENKP